MALSISLTETPQTIDASLDVGSDGAVRLRLVNDGAWALAFKALTNAPVRRWAFKPNSGVLDPQESVEVVATLLQPVASADPWDDRHILLSLPCTEDEAAMLRQQRSSGGRLSIEALHAHNPAATQVRLCPQPPNLCPTNLGQRLVPAVAQRQLPLHPLPAP